MDERRTARKARTQATASLLNASTSRFGTLPERLASGLELGSVDVPVAPREYPAANVHTPRSPIGDSLQYHWRRLLHRDELVLPQPPRQRGTTSVAGARQLLQAPSLAAPRRPLVHLDVTSKRGDPTPEVRNVAGHPHDRVTGIDARS